MRILPQNARITSGEIIYKGINLLKCSEKEIRSIRGKKNIHGFIGSFLKS